MQNKFINITEQYYRYKIETSDFYQEPKSNQKKREQIDEDIDWTYVNTLSFK